MIISFLFDLNRKYHEPKYTNYHKYQVSGVYKMINNYEIYVDTIMIYRD